MKRSQMSDKLDAAGVHGSARTILLAEMDDAGMPWEAEEPEMAERLEVGYAACDTWTLSVPGIRRGSWVRMATRAEIRAAAVFYNRRRGIAAVASDLRTWAAGEWPDSFARITFKNLLEWADLLDGKG